MAAYLLSPFELPHILTQRNCSGCQTGLNQRLVPCSSLLMKGANWEMLFTGIPVMATRILITERKYLPLDKGCVFKE